MKQFRHSLTVALCLLATQATAQTVEAEKTRVDFKKANPILQAIAAQMTEKHVVVQDAIPTFDEDYSNLEENRLRYHLDANLVNAPWKKNDVGTIRGTTTYRLKKPSDEKGLVKDDEPKNKDHRLSVEFDITVKTDVLAFLRHAGSETIKYGHYKRSDDNMEIQKKTRELLERLSEVESLEAFEALLREGQEHAKMIIDSELERLERKIKAKTESIKIADSIKIEDLKNKKYPSGELLKKLSQGQNYLSSLQYLVDEYRHFQKEREAYRTTLIARNKKTNEVVVINQDLANFASRGIGKNVGGPLGRISFTETGLVSYGKLQIDLDPSSSDHLVNELRKALTLLNQGKEEGQKMVKRAYREALRVFKEVVLDHEFMH